jgi:hypothetical protein
MSRSNTDPLPGDLDEEFKGLDPADVQVVEASHDHRRLVVQFRREDADAAALQEMRLLA